MNLLQHYNLENLYTDIHSKDEFPQNYVEELVLIGKLTDDNELKAQIKKTLTPIASKDTLKAFSDRKKFAENNALEVLLKVASVSKDLDMGKMLNLLTGDTVTFKSDFKDFKLLEGLGRFSNIRSITVKTKQAFDLPESIVQLENLEELIIEVNPFAELPDFLAQIPNLKKLRIDISDLKIFPDFIFEMESLEELAILGLGFPKDIKDPIAPKINKLANLKKLTLRGLKQKELDDLVFDLPSLESLVLKGIKGLKSLPESIGKLQKLNSLKIENCPALSELTFDASQMLALESLHLDELPRLKMVDASFFNLPTLSQLTLNTKVFKLSNIPESFSNNLVHWQTNTLAEVSLFLAYPQVFNNMLSLEVRVTIENMDSKMKLPKLKQVVPNLRSLFLMSFRLDVFDCLSKIPNLEKLTVRSGEFETIPESLLSQKHLKELSVLGRSKFKLETSKLPECDFEVLSLTAKDVVFDNQQPIKASVLNIDGQIALTDKFNLEGVKSLSLTAQEEYTVLPEIAQLTGLQSLKLGQAFKEIPSSIKELKELEHLEVNHYYRGSEGERDCNHPIDFIAEIGTLESLKYLNFEGCFDAVPSSLEGLTNLETLILKKEVKGGRSVLDKNINEEDLPFDISKLAKLKEVELL